MPDYGFSEAHLEEKSPAEKVHNLSDLLLKPRDEDLIYARTQFRIIKKYVQDFQSSLDANHDVGLLLTSFGQSVLMSVTEIGYDGPVLMVFRGYVNGTMSTLMQHINQLNFLLTSIPGEPGKPKRKIGFTANWAEQ